MDCGNKNAMVDTNTKVLGFLKDDKGLVSPKPEEHQQRGDPALLHRRGRDLDEQHRRPERFHREQVPASPTAWCGIRSCAAIRVYRTAVIDNSMIGERAIVTGTALDLSMSDDSTFG